jgi:hypothetical protein
VPRDDGSFKLYGISPGSFRIVTKPPLDTWFVRSLELPASPAPKTQGAKTSDVSTDKNNPKVGVSAGERKTGIVITAASGGSTLKGTVRTGNASNRLPSHVRVSLVPAEAEKQRDLLRYAQVFADFHGEFAFRNLAPGRYYVLATAIAAERFAEPNPQSEYLSSRERSALLHAAETANQVLELKVCENMKGIAIIIGAGAKH